MTKIGWTNIKKMQQVYLQQLVAYDEAGLGCQTAVIDGGHKDASWGAGLDVEAHGLGGRLLKGDVSGLMVARPVSGEGGNH